MLVLTSDHITPATGKTPTVTIAKNDGVGFVTPSGSVSELGNGWYAVAPNATDASTLGPITLHATASGCDPSDEEFVVVNYSPTATTPTATPSTTTISVGDLITAALRRINVLQAGEPPTPDDFADGMLRFGDLIDALGIEPLTIYQVARTTWTLTSSKGYPGSPYTVGPSGDLNIARPMPNNIHAWAYQDTSVTPTQEYALWNLTEQAYRAIPQKTLTSPLPNSAYYEPTYPTGSLYLWQVPTKSQLQGVLYALTAIPVFGATSDLIALPPGYRRMLRDNLAVEFWPEYREGSPIDPELMRIAMESKALVKASNVRMTDLRLDPAVTRRGGWYDINSDGIW